MMYAKVGLFMLEKLYITSNLLALSYDFAECPCIIRAEFNLQMQQNSD